jgi:hypothetical protein
MNPRFPKLDKSLTKAGRDQRARQKRVSLLLERLEDRWIPNAATAQHELLLSVDGLHNAKLHGRVNMASMPRRGGCHGFT